MSMWVFMFANSDHASYTRQRVTLSYANFTFFGYAVRSGIAGSYGRSIFSCLNTLPADFIVAGLASTQWSQVEASTFLPFTWQCSWEPFYLEEILPSLKLWEYLKGWGSPACFNNVYFSLLGQKWYLFWFLTLEKASWPPPVLCFAMFDLVRSAKPQV